MTLRVPPAPAIRPATQADLAAVNIVIEAAIMNGSLPERVKRLSADSHRYGAMDLRHQAIRVAVDDDGRIIGVAAFEQASRRETPGAARGLLLHGLYVDPGSQRRGVGRALLASVVSAARYAGHAGVLVKASRDAVGFFRGQGFVRVTEQAALAYPDPFWLEVDP